uniref:Ninjurin a n=1 Tax=Lutzomyia longipalpis TaxID=7200 RepID=A0A1B0GJ41_LUTLO
MSFSFVVDIHARDLSVLSVTMDGGRDIEMGKLGEGGGAKVGADAIDGRRSTKSEYASKKSVAEGMMDIALLTANANQLRFLITYNTESRTFYIMLGLLITSLALQIAVGIALIFKVLNSH